MNKYGFRDDFDWSTRFDLKSQVGKYLVSTVDLGIDHNFLGVGAPLYYETMIFKTDKKGNIDFGGIDYQERYSTQKEAEIGHQKAIDFVNNNLKGGLE